MIDNVGIAIIDHQKWVVYYYYTHITKFPIYLLVNARGNVLTEAIEVTISLCIIRMSV